MEALQSKSKVEDRLFSSICFSNKSTLVYLEEESLLRSEQLAKFDKGRKLVLCGEEGFWDQMDTQGKCFDLNHLSSLATKLLWKI